MTFATLLACSLLASAPQDRKAFDEYMKDPAGWVKLGAVPAIKLQTTRTATREEAERIKELIQWLQKIESPDVGLSGTMSGGSFSPLGKSEFSSGLLTNHAIEPNQAVAVLVHLGPKALPFLLKALEDSTPTKLVITHGAGFDGGMWYSQELGGNPANTKEWAVLAKKRKGDAFGSATIDKHVVTVGDVCFVALGQIVGRSYSAIRYQPSACIIVNSPTHDEAYRALVREIWESPDADQALLDSLLLDYSTNGVFNGRSLDGWGLGSSLQCDAALRLLYYYPNEAAPLVVERLNKLDVTRGDGMDAWMKTTVQNGVRAVEFIKAVAWTSNAEVRDAVVAVMKRTNDSELFRAGIPASRGKDDRMVLERLKADLAALPKEERGSYGEGYHLLLLLGDHFPESAKPLFAEYVRDPSPQRVLTICHVLLKTRGEWALELLCPLLADSRELRWGYGVAGGSPLSGVSSRACDEAAKTIYAHNPDLVFLIDGDRANLDRQIVAMRKQIDDRQKK
ncbi:MAG TPA: hypothetical protein VE981_09720 [Planctomycetota bacterium]|nr:hypothetical protein [Planctomycetota bacterium]